MSVTIILYFVITTALCTFTLIYLLTYKKRKEIALAEKRREVRERKARLYDAKLLSRYSAKNMTSLVGAAVFWSLLVPFVMYKLTQPKSRSCRRGH